jgi:hypothetical protein
MKREMWIKTPVHWHYDRRQQTYCLVNDGFSSFAYVENISNGIWRFNDSPERYKTLALAQSAAEQACGVVG